MLAGLALMPPVDLEAVTGSEPPARPNVLLIISDDHGWADYGFMGHPQIRTPHLDRLADRSLVFTRGYSPVPLCRPSLASIATGLHPHRHGVTGNDPDLPDPKINAMAARGQAAYARYYDTIVGHFARHPDFIRDLSARGYCTFQTGKWWEGSPVKTAGFTHAMTTRPAASNTGGSSMAGGNSWCPTATGARGARPSCTICVPTRGRRGIWRIAIPVAFEGCSAALIHGGTLDPFQGSLQQVLPEEQHGAVEVDDVGPRPRMLARIARRTGLQPDELDGLGLRAHLLRRRIGIGLQSIRGSDGACHRRKPGWSGRHPKNWIASVQ